MSAEPQRWLVADRHGVRVMRERCATCIFRPGNLMHLERGRVRRMLDTVRDVDGCIPCHETLGDDTQAVCRGQYETAPTSPMQLATALGAIVEWDRPSDADA